MCNTSSADWKTSCFQILFTKDASPPAYLFGSLEFGMSWSCEHWKIQPYNLRSFFFTTIEKIITELLH